MIEFVNYDVNDVLQYLYNPELDALKLLNSIHQEVGRHADWAKGQISKIFIE